MTEPPDDVAWDPEEDFREKPVHAVFEGAATGGLLGAALGWVIAQIAKRRRSR